MHRYGKLQSKRSSIDHEVSKPSLWYNSEYSLCTRHKYDRMLPTTYYETGVMTGMNIVMALLALGFLVFIHELGHYWAARASGIRVEEFAIGFGPPILKYKRNGIAY
ncbi:MAG: site-2 protease family protein, partial [Tumebacillaceae bacterium]